MGPTAGPQTYGRALKMTTQLGRRAAPQPTIREENMLKFWSLTTAIAVTAFALATTAGAQAGEFDGVTVNVMTQTGAIQEPLARRAPDFEKATGAKINT